VKNDVRSIRLNDETSGLTGATVSFHEGRRIWIKRMKDSLDTWFRAAVLPHEEGLRRFLSRMWSDPTEIADLCHDAYVRMYEAARVSRPRNPKNFLFATARHIVIDRMRRRRVVVIHALEPQHCDEHLVDCLSPERQAIAANEFGCLLDAIERLPRRSREVLWLRRVRELSQRETAEALRVSEKAVEKHLHLATHRLLHVVRS